MFSKVLFYLYFQVGRVKWICVFEHSVITNFNCACPAIQRGQGSGFLSEGSSWLTACMSEQQRFWETERMCRFTWTFAARIGDKYQICLTRFKWYQFRTLHRVVYTILAGQIISKSFIFFPPETELTSQILVSNQDFLRFATSCVKYLKVTFPFSKVCVQAWACIYHF